MKPSFRRTFAAACAVAVALGLTASLAPAAYAGKLVREDAPRDVVKVEFNDGSLSRTLAPRRQDPDMRRVTIDYRKGALVIRVKYAALNRMVGRSEFVLVETRNGSLLGQVNVFRPGRWQGETLFPGEQDESICPAGKHRFDYQARVSIWTIPPLCLDRSPWVRVGLSGGLIGNERGFTDNAFAKGKAQRPYLSPRVWRG